MRGPTSECNLGLRPTAMDSTQNRIDKPYQRFWAIVLHTFGVQVQTMYLGTGPLEVRNGRDPAGSLLWNPGNLMPKGEKIYRVVIQLEAPTEGATASV